MVLANALYLNFGSTYLTKRIGQNLEQVSRKNKYVNFILKGMTTEKEKKKRKLGFPQFLYYKIIISQGFHVL